MNEIFATLDNNWESVLLQLGIQIPPLNKPGPCPMCGGDDRFIFDDKNGCGSWLCRKCQPGQVTSGNGYQLVKNALGLSDGEVIKQLKEIVGIATPSTQKAFLQRQAKQDETKVQEIKIQQANVRKAERIIENASEQTGHKYFDAKGLEEVEVLVTTKTVPIGERTIAKGSIVVPMRRVSDKLVNVQLIDDEGNKFFLPGKGCVGGAFHLIGDIHSQLETLLIAEGYASGLSAALASELPVAVAFSATNIKKVAENLRKALPTTDFIFLADDDAISTDVENVGIQAANNAIDLVGGAVLPPPFSEDEKSSLTENDKPKRKYTDWDDFRQLRGLEPVKRILLNEIGKLSFENIKVTLQPIAEIKNETSKLNSALPPGFMLNKDGLYFNKASFDDDENYIRLSSPIRVLGYTHDRSSENWGVLVEFKDRRDESKRYAIPCDMAITNFNEVIGIMTNLGLPYANPRGLAGEQLKIYLSTNQINNFVCCVDQVGWFISAEHKSFVLPDRVIGHDSEKVVLQSRSPIGCGFNQKNELTDWQQNIGLLCKGNSRLLFSVSCAFAAPLLRLIGLEGGGFHLGGSSSDGKTTCLMVASSVCSSPDFLESWRATGNALEATASLHNDCLLPLDEIKQANCKDVGETAYMLANGQGKARANKQGDLRQRKSWLLIALSTGELGFDEMLREANQEAYAGIEVRFPEIPSNTGKYGAFENIHGFESAKAFADHIRAQVHSYFGTPLTAFLENLSLDIDVYATEAQQSMRAISKQLCEASMESQVFRVADRFAIVAAAGELATQLGVTTWSKGEAIWGVTQCFKSWLESRGHTGNKEGVKALQHVKDYIFKNLNSRFADFNSPDSTIINLVGWKQLEASLDEDGDDDSRLLLKIPSSGWREIAKGSGMRAVDLAQLCIAQGIMLKPNGKGLQFNSKLPGMGSVKHYRLLASNTVG